MESRQNTEENKDIFILPIDNGKSMFTIDKSEYIEKCVKLLSDEKTHVKLKADSTTKKKIIRQLNNRGRFDSQTSNPSTLWQK